MCPTVQLAFREWLHACTCWLLIPVLSQTLLHADAYTYCSFAVHILASKTISTSWKTKRNTSTFKHRLSAAQLGSPSIHAESVYRVHYLPHSYYQNWGWNQKGDNRQIIFIWYVHRVWSSHFTTFIASEKVTPPKLIYQTVELDVVMYMYGCHYNHCTALDWVDWVDCQLKLTGLAWGSTF